MKRNEGGKKVRKEVEREEIGREMKEAKLERR